MFAVKLTYFSPKKIGQQDISSQLIPQYWVLNVQNIIEL